MELDALVTTVAASVNENFLQQMVEETFRCLGFFPSRIDDAVPEICEELTRDGGCTMDEISKAILAGAGKVTQRQRRFSECRNSGRYRLLGRVGQF